MARFLVLLASMLFVAAGIAAADEAKKVIVDPNSIELATPGAMYSILVHGESADGRRFDLTRQVVFRSAAPGIVTVSSSGVVRGLKDGVGRVEVVAGRRVLPVTVRVRNVRAARRFNFENDVVPILSRFGCNSSACHGKAEGQNGFKLSVFGFDPSADYASLVKEGRGRRVFPGEPRRSLLLQKAAGGLPHGGGARIADHSPQYETLRGWIAAGMPRGGDDDPRVVEIRLSPRRRVMNMKAAQQLRVVARFSDGREEDVTALAKFQSNNDALLQVDHAGLVTAGQVPGGAAVMASYMGAVDVFQVLAPRPAGRIANPSYIARNFIDDHINRQLRRLNIAPSPPADDAEFLRRVYLDVIGTLPTAVESRRFLGDAREDKRRRLVDGLLRRREFADYWALVWADLLRVDRQTLGHKGAYEFYAWIRDGFARNKPLDRFARELLTAEGPLRDAPQGHFYQVAKKPGEMASTLSQVLLGVRIACAQCHHHPFDRWSQRDYLGMQGFFAQLRNKKSPAGNVLFAAGSPQLRHPRSGESVFPYPLGESMPEEMPPRFTPSFDRRRELADWLTAGDNRWFARNLANRVWARFLGRGLVEPVDDVRATNPPSNPELLDALAAHLVKSKFDFHELIRAITASAAYQRSSATNGTNRRDEQNYSRALFKRLGAEVLLDAVCQTTGVGEKFRGVPGGRRAVQLWDSRSQHYFLKLFGRPTRETACECERTAEASIAQVLHLMNSPRLHEKVAHEGGKVADLTRRISDDERLVEELYLTFYSRYPDERERQVAREHFRQSENRRQAAEDLAWSMLNTLEFVFNH